MSLEAYALLDLSASTVSAPKRLFLVRHNCTHQEFQHSGNRGKRPLKVVMIEMLWKGEVRNREDGGRKGTLTKIKELLKVTQLLVTISGQPGDSVNALRKFQKHWIQFPSLFL